jgi:ethanolamine ammonia-lyase large subunit
VSAYFQVAGGDRHRFADLKMLLACASPQRSGDELAGIAATSEQQRVAARMALADLPLRTFLHEAVVPYEADEVTRLIIDSHDAAAFAPLASLTLGEFRNWLLSTAVTTPQLQALAPGLTPEMVAAVSKLMRNQDLITVGAKCEVVTAFRTTVGARGTLASRLQPNHPTDDPKGVLASTLDGLRFGIGDAVIGVNPSTDSISACVTLLTMLDDLRQRFEIPTQSCVLSHVTTTMAAIAQGAPVDLVFQSIAGTEAANAGFGITLAMLAEAHTAARSLNRGTVGRNVMYFETGQGSALSANAHHGVDQQTLETRAYAVARAFDPFLVNTVVGFIGPEYLYDGRQITRAGLEDHFCGKLLGLPMGVDVCYTNHADADQNDMDVLMNLLALSGVNFLIAVPGADDVMLNYQSLSYQDIVGVRRLQRLKAAPEFEAWLARMGLPDAPDAPALLQWLDAS